MLLLLRACVGALFVLGLAVSCSAQAQVASPACYPFGLKGKALTWAPKYVENANGSYGYIFCDLGYAIKAEGRCIETGLKERYVNQFSADLQAALNQSSVAQIVAALDALNVKYANPQPNPVNEAICRNLADDIKANQPPQPVWVVAKNGATPTRPTYVFADGKRGALAAERVAVGEPCNALDAYVPGVSNAYAAVLGRKDRVSICVRK